MDQATKQEFISFMMASDVLRFGDFVTKSGRRTPYFVNTGMYRTGAQIGRLGEFYASIVQEVCRAEFDALFGPAYKGIPLVTACAAALDRCHNLDKPFFFNRKEAKDHGEGGALVGYPPKDGDRIVIIEDVITAGTAVRETLPLLQACADVRVEHMFISVDRCEVGQTPGKTAVMEVKEQYGIQVHSIVNVRDIHVYLKGRPEYAAQARAMEGYMAQYCV